MAEAHEDTEEDLANGGWSRGGIRTECVIGNWRKNGTVGLLRGGALGLNGYFFLYNKNRSTMLAIYT